MYTSAMTDDLFEPIAAIPAINSQQQIDDAVRDNPTYNPGFVWVAIRQDLRDRVNERWMQIRHLCEPNFITEFRGKDTYYARLWELNLRYLFATALTGAPGDGEPDLVADSFAVEAGVPAPSDVPDLKFDMRLYTYPTDEIARRTTKVLTDKLAQFNRRLTDGGSRIDYSTTPYVIAVGLPQREFRDAVHMNGMDIVEAVLMGAGPLQLTISAGGTKGDVGISSQGTMTTRNGTEFDIAYFQRDEWKGVSAVMWSAEWLPEIDDLKLLLNPNANIPLDPTVLGNTPQVITYTKTDVGYTRDQKLND
jgi:hypothetical protein